MFKKKLLNAQKLAKKKKNGNHEIFTYGNPVTVQHIVP